MYHREDIQIPRKKEWIICYALLATPSDRPIMRIAHSAMLLHLWQVNQVGSIRYHPLHLRGEAQLHLPLAMDGATRCHKVHSREECTTIRCGARLWLRNQYQGLHTNSPLRCYRCNTRVDLKRHSRR